MFLPAVLPPPNVTISFTGTSTAGQNYTLTCSAAVVADLVVQPHLKIVFPNSTAVAVEKTSSLEYTFSPLKTSDAGNYTCTATINISGIVSVSGSAVENITVASEL